MSSGFSHDQLNLQKNDQEKTQIHKRWNQQGNSTFYANDLGEKQRITHINTNYSWERETYLY